MHLKTRFPSSFTKIGLLEIHEEAFIQASDAFQELPSNQKETATDIVHGTGMLKNLSSIPLPIQDLRNLGESMKAKAQADLHPNRRKLSIGKL